MHLFHVKVAFCKTPNCAEPFLPGIVKRKVNKVRAFGARAAGQHKQKICKPSKNSDQPAPLCSLARVPVSRCMRAKNPGLLQRRLWSDCSDCVTWSWVFPGRTGHDEEGFAWGWLCPDFLTFIVWWSQWSSLWNSTRISSRFMEF